MAAEDNLAPPADNPDSGRTLSRYKSQLIALCVCLAIFGWTNWYFSPERRLGRLAENMLESGIDGMPDSDINLLMSQLHSPIGGFSDVHSSCYALPKCEVTSSTSFKMPANAGHKTLYLDVSVLVQASLSESKWSAWFPTRLRWKGQSWKWHVKVIDYENGQNNVFYSGTFEELGQLPDFVDRRPVMSLLNGMQKGMNKQLLEEN